MCVCMWVWCVCMLVCECMWCVLTCIYLYGSCSFLSCLFLYVNVDVHACLYMHAYLSRNICMYTSVHICVGNCWPRRNYRVEVGNLMAKNPGWIFWCHHSRPYPTSLVCGSCKTINEYPYCTEGAMQLWRWGCYPTANGATNLVAFCWLTS